MEKWNHGFKWKHYKDDGSRSFVVGLSLTFMHWLKVSILIITWPLTSMVEFRRTSLTTFWFWSCARQVIHFLARLSYPLTWTYSFNDKVSNMLKMTTKPINVTQFVMDFKTFKSRRIILQLVDLFASWKFDSMTFFTYLQWCTLPYV